ncbi:MAG: hypothetical protein GWO07_03675, partial [Candidatus Dadabacteria bacterium]|nr:hypothetical protein [Candidatus Dadabacteria bacterium]NIS07864.1 hypothetical protein [Candidatus Dadabacteria bacterium]NIV42836.1 hypothetical protein [Candidatus Dadabacteria bacterium]NIY21652.1 hypothetical protein [Candidatus Dadabacteria bacterium]
GADRNLFKRIILESNGTEFFGYNAGSRLNFPQNAYPRITSGNWRRHGSISSNDICSFALEFEKVQSKRYGVFAEKGHSSFVHIKGNIPILAVACHATAHKREGKLKAQEFYTGAIGVILNSISGVHCLYTTYASEFDSNYCQQTELKEYIREVVKKHKIKFVLDIHGTGSYRKFDIYPGIGKAGEFLNGKNILMNNLERILHKNSIKLGGTDVFPAYRQHTVSRFVNSLLEIPAMQLEINQKYRDPQTDSLSFEKLTNTLADYLASVEKHI